MLDSSLIDDFVKKRISDFLISHFVEEKKLTIFAFFFYKKVNFILILSKKE